MNTSLDSVIRSIPPPCREQFLQISDSGFEERGIAEAGYSRLHEGYEIVRPKGFFRWNLVLFIVGGSGKCFDGSNEENLRTGDILQVRARREIAYRATGKWDFIFFHIHESDPYGYMVNCSDESLHIQRSIHFKHLLASVRWYLRETAASFPQEKSLSKPYAEIICTCLDRELQHGKSNPRLEQRRELLKTLWQEVDANISYPWSQVELASRLNMSIAHFVRAVNDLEGTTPMRRVAEIRFRRARNLLTYTDYTLDHIAELVGYNSPFSFSRAFQRLVGKSPQTYRRTHRESGAPMMSG